MSMDSTYHSTTQLGSATARCTYTTEYVNDLRAQLQQHVNEKSHLYDVIYKLQIEINAQNHEIELIKQYNTNVQIIDSDIVQQCQTTKYNHINIMNINTNTSRMSSRDKLECITQLNNLLVHYHTLYTQLLHRHTLQSIELQHIQHVYNVQSDQLSTQQAELHKLNLLELQNQHYVDDINQYKSIVDQLNLQQHILTAQLSKTCQLQHNRQQQYLATIQQLQQALRTMRHEWDTMKQSNVTELNELHIHSTTQLQLLSDRLAAQPGTASSTTQDIGSQSDVRLQTDYVRLQSEYNEQKHLLNTLQIQYDTLLCVYNDLQYDNQSLHTIQTDLLNSYTNLTTQRNSILCEHDSSTTTQLQSTSPTESYNIIRHMRRTSELELPAEHTNIAIQTESYTIDQQSYIRSLQSQIYALSELLERGIIHSLHKPHAISTRKQPLHDYEEKSNSARSNNIASPLYNTK